MTAAKKSASKVASHLLEFYGTECHFCIQMAPTIEKLEKELGVTITKYEVWHDDENAKLLEQYDKGHCGGVPFFYNTKTDKWICGYAEYDELKTWAEGK